MYMASPNRFYGSIFPRFQLVKICNLEGCTEMKFSDYREDFWHFSNRLTFEVRIRWKLPWQILALRFDGQNFEEPGKDEDAKFP